MAKPKIANPWDDVKLLAVLLIAGTFVPVVRPCYYCGMPLEGQYWPLHGLWIDSLLDGYAAHDDCDAHDRPRHPHRWEARPTPLTYVPWWAAKAFWGPVILTFMLAVLAGVARTWWMMYRLGNYHPGRMLQIAFLLLTIYLLPDLLTYAFDGTEAQERILEKYGFELMPYRTKVVWTPLPDENKGWHLLQGSVAAVGWLVLTYLYCFFPYRKDPYGIEHASPRFAAVCQKLFGLSKHPEDVKLQNPKVQEEGQEGPGAQAEAGPSGRAEVLRDREQAQDAAPAGGLYPDTGRRPDVQGGPDGSPGRALPDPPHRPEG